MAADEQLIRDVEGTLEAVASALSALQASTGLGLKLSQCTALVLVMVSSTICSWRIQLLVLQMRDSAVLACTAWLACSLMVPVLLALQQ